ncbi:MAG: DUF302 domain-containing protein [Gammaproteobacteria bacterium]|nr:DUF302 domain-containing protein [Gammaproteobacteria bacterium]
MKSFKTGLSAEAAVTALIGGIEAENMRIVAHINGQANAAKMGKQVPADQILEVFRPDYAIRVWQACKEAGHDIPLRIHVYEDDDDVVVACRMPSEVFAPFGVPELNAIGTELDGIFDNILATAKG